MFIWVSRKRDTPILERSEGDFSLDDGIAFVLLEEQFLSVRQIAKKVMASK
jgi:hypothetical protein